MASLVVDRQGRRYSYIQLWHIPVCILRYSKSVPTTLCHLCYIPPHNRGGGGAIHIARSTGPERASDAAGHAVR